jgi:hypothetical protein
MTKQQTRRAIIEYKTAKPFVDALALGLGSSAFAVVFQGPAFNWACIGAGFSLVFYWGSANLTSPKKTKPKPSPSAGGQVLVTSLLIRSTALARFRLKVASSTLPVLFHGKRGGRRYGDL